ncbi:uncharacterized protein LOC142644263 [Castanea sativa]|uniref:uncharacterized protein LOC142644263 n=1 Tax=Castanea sativa TaxID=21020 RepID=UPI003F649654
MLWKEEGNLHIQTYSPHHIDAIILTDPGVPWQITGFYGYSKECHKHESWTLLHHLHSQLFLPWMCIGKYNEILSSEEKQGLILKAYAPMIAFRSTLLHCGLIDVRFHENIFIRNNGRPGDAFIQERIDRAYANGAWRELFLRSWVVHLSASYSNHIPILLVIHMAREMGRRKVIPHRFEEKWASHLKCGSIIEDA